MKRYLALLYGLVSYAMFVGTFAYLAGFVCDLAPKSIDSSPADPLWVAMSVNALLIGLFGVQHSVMARPAFKRWWTKYVPEPVERSTYVLFSNLALIVLFWGWRPMGGVIWDIQQPVGRVALYALAAAGWLGVFATTLLINHFDLFGVRQVWLYFQGKPYTAPGFVTPGPYKLIRHPLYLGWMTAFWATPTMTVTHLVFAIGTTAYMLIAIPFEERDLLKFHGEKYASYRNRVPMLIPSVAHKDSTQNVAYAGEAVPQE